MCPFPNSGDWCWGRRGYVSGVSSTSMVTVGIGCRDGSGWSPLVRRLCGDQGMERVKGTSWMLLAAGPLGKNGERAGPLVRKK